jgi:hypothetical protein
LGAVFYLPGSGAGLVPEKSKRSLLNFFEEFLVSARVRDLRTVASGERAAWNGRESRGSQSAAADSQSLSSTERPLASHVPEDLHF